MHQNSRRFIKAFPKFECNIYSDIDFQSAISVSSTGNSRSLTELTDRLAFVNFSSPALMCGELSVTFLVYVTNDRKQNPRLERVLGDSFKPA